MELRYMHYETLVKMVCYGELSEEEAELIATALDED